MPVGHPTHTHTHTHTKQKWSMTFLKMFHFTQDCVDAVCEREGNGQKEKGEEREAEESSLCVKRGKLEAGGLADKSERGEEEMRRRGRRC